MSGAAPFWGPSGGPRNGSASTKYVYRGGRKTAPILCSFFGPGIFKRFFGRRCVRGGLIPGSAWRIPNRVRRFKSHSGGLATWQTFRSVFATEICVCGGREAGRGRQRQAEARRGPENARPLRDLFGILCGGAYQWSSGPQGVSCISYGSKWESQSTGVPQSASPFVDWDPKSVD